MRSQDPLLIRKWHEPGYLGTFFIIESLDHTLRKTLVLSLHRCQGTHDDFTYWGRHFLPCWTCLLWNSRTCSFCVPVTEEIDMGVEQGSGTLTEWEADPAMQHLVSHSAGWGLTHTWQCLALTCLWDCIIVFSSHTVWLNSERNAW
jgi:hypothetical protein